jgi:hypothetical protein
MEEIRFRLYFNEKPATQEQLNSVEEITVEQEIDMTWEAQIKFLIYTDGHGRWTTEGMDFLKSFIRARVEVKNRTDSFDPLIEGPVVGYDCRMSSQPGQSSLSLKVRDDSVYLEREEVVGEFSDKSDEDIATEILSRFKDYIDFKDKTSISSFTNSSPPYFTHRGNAMTLLRRLAERKGYYIYILPGEKAGKSIAHFHSIPLDIVTQEPALVLTGKESNMENFDISFNPIRPVIVSASYLNSDDKSIVTAVSSYENLDILGKENPLDSENEFGKVYLSPLIGGQADLVQAVNAEAARASHAFEARGTVRRCCYHGALMPYKVVNISGLSTELCGNYLVQRVSHNLTRSYYDQSFTVTRNARSPAESTDASATARSLIS